MSILSAGPFTALVAIFFAMVLLRYVAIAGSLFVLCWIWPSPGIKARQVHSRLPGRNQWLMEFKWSVVTTALFAVIGVVMLHLWQIGYTAIYLDWNQLGSLYGVCSFVLYALIHETYFYWMHRSIHHPKLFPYFHRIHHLSVRPSPWASFSFNPSEALLEAAIVPILLLIIPIHPYTLIAYLTFMTITSVINHLGFELYPAGTAQNFLGKWLIGATHHGQHHRYSTCNYGLYFTIWDRLCGTQRADYERRFAENTRSPLFVKKPRSETSKFLAPPDSLP